MRRLVYAILLVVFTIFLLIPTFSIAKLGNSSKHVSDIADIWWQRIENKNPNFYRKVDVGRVIVHLCGSKEKMEDKLGYKIKDLTYMFTSYDGKLPVHIWLIVKIENKGKIVFHKWATGHEFIRLLNILTPDILDPGKYQ